MRQLVKLPKALFFSFIVFSVVISCNPDDGNPTQIPAYRLCQISNLFYLGAQHGDEGFPEFFTSPMQYWDFGMTDIAYNSDGYPISLRGYAPAFWERMTIEYNSNNTAKSITLHAFKSAPNQGVICANDTCEKAYLFSYDNNNRPIKVTGEIRDWYGNFINNFPVCENEYDANGRLTKQLYPNGNYWRFEYVNGNVSRMYLKTANNAEQLRYLFMSYDTKVNPTRTNPIWQLYLNTYSNNNPLSYRRFTGKKISLPTGGTIDEFVDVKVNYNYGANFGQLPTTIEFTDADGKPLSGYENFVAYKCDPIPVGGKKTP